MNTCLLVVVTVCWLTVWTAVRMQFYAIEIARNRAGLNDWVYEKAQEKKES